MLAQKFSLTGGLIKNAIFMALQNSVSRNGGSKISLELTDLEKTAAYQSASMVNQQGPESIYQPKISLEEVGLRSEDKKLFQRVISTYERFQGKALGMNFVIASSDIQTGIDCVEGVGKACNLNVKRFPFFDVIYDLIQNEQSSSSRRDWPFFAKKGTLQAQVFNPCPGKQALVLLVDNDSVFQQLLYRKRTVVVRLRPCVSWALESA